MDKLTPEQLEMQEAERQANKEIREKLNLEIHLGKQLKKLKTNPVFKELFLELFISKGKKILWENIEHLTEGQMMGKGSERNLQVIEGLKKQVEVRLNVEAFMNTIERDAENAAEEIVNMDKEEEEEAKAEEAAAKGGE